MCVGGGSRGVPVNTPPPPVKMRSRKMVVTNLEMKGFVKQGGA